MRITLCFIILALAIFQVSAQKNPPSKKAFRDCKTCPEMVLIPGGSFMMGSPDNEIGRAANPEEGPVEGPQRLVNIKPFAAGKYDITKQQWAAFAKATNRLPGGKCGWANLQGYDSTQPWLPDPAANWNHVGFVQDSSHPAVCISWDDAFDYTQWLSKKTGRKYRLLSEAEWEYANRAGATTPYYWGSTPSQTYANYGTDSANGIGLALLDDKWIYTSPVGSFPPNPFGLYDMSGNVWQWVDDCYSGSYLGVPNNGSAFKSDQLIDSTNKYPWMLKKNACAFHIVRGGCYADSPRLLRSAFRNMGGIPGAMDPDLSRSAGGGFRVARDL